MNEKILKQIKNIRKQKGISLKEISSKAKISYTYLSMLESGKKLNPSLNVLTKIAKALNVKITFIYTE